MSQRSQKQRKQKFRVQNLPKQLQHINVYAAGIDIGAAQHLVAVPEGRAAVSVRQFGTMRRDYGGNGIDRGLLDPVVRATGTAGIRSKAGRRATGLERFRSQV